MTTKRQYTLEDTAIAKPYEKKDIYNAIMNINSLYYNIYKNIAQVDRQFIADAINTYIKHCVEKLVKLYFYTSDTVEFNNILQEVLLYLHNIDFLLRCMKKCKICRSTAGIDKEIAKCIDIIKNFDIDRELCKSK